MHRSPTSSKASCAASPSAATSRRASCGQPAAAAATSCGCPSRARAAASARRAWAGAWPREPRWLTEALTVRVQRTIRGDGTISIGGLDWESACGWLSRKRVLVGRSFADPTLAPWVEHEGKRLALTRVAERELAYQDLLPRKAKPAPLVLAIERDRETHLGLSVHV